MYTHFLQVYSSCDTAFGSVRTSICNGQSELLDWVSVVRICLPSLFHARSSTAAEADNRSGGQSISSWLLVRLFPNALSSSHFIAFRPRWSYTLFAVVLLSRYRFLLLLLRLARLYYPNTLLPLDFIAAAVFSTWLSCPTTSQFLPLSPP